MKKEVITQADPKSPVSEVFRALRTNLQFMNRFGKSQTILITSTVQAEGKSWVSANLATAYAQTGRKVILIDADMRKPRQHKIFSLKMCPGLSNYLSEVNELGRREKFSYMDCIQKTEVENLSLLPSGNIPPNPSELLLTEKLEELISKLGNEYEVIIFDGAPCLLVTDSTIISRMVDSTVLVVSHKYTKVDDLKEAKKRIKSVGGKLIGVVLNRVEISSKKYADKYYYANNMMSSTNVKRAKHREITEEVEEVKPRKESSREREYIKPKKEIKEDKEYTRPKQEKHEDKKREEKIIQDYIDDKVEDTERKIMEEIEKEKGKRFATVKEVPSDKAREILESINNYK